MFEQWPSTCDPPASRRRADYCRSGSAAPAVACDVGTVVLERLVTDLAELGEAMVRRALRAAEKIRLKGLGATRLIAFTDGSRYKRNPPSASRLSPPTDDPRIIGTMAGRMMEAMFQRRGVYTKGGELLEELVPEGTG